MVGDSGRSFDLVLPLPGGRLTTNEIAEQAGSGRRLSAALLNFRLDDSIFPTGSERRLNSPAPPVLKR